MADKKYGKYRDDYSWKGDISDTKQIGLTMPGAPSASGDATQYAPGTYIHRLMKGATMADSKSIMGYTPFITGRSVFIVTKMPRFMEIVAPSETALFRHLTQFYTKSITGFQDLNLGTTTIDNGVEGAGIDIATSMTGDTRDVTIEYGPDTRGLFINKYVRMWMCGIIDPLTDTGTYLDAFDDEKYGSALEWDIANHTMEGIQLILDPTKRKIEAQALITCMHPKNAPGAIFESTNGQHDFVIPSIQYSAKVYPNLVDIDEVLKEIDILGYIRTARYNTISMSHVLDDKKESLKGEISRIANSFNSTTGRQTINK